MFWGCVLGSLRELVVTEGGGDGLRNEAGRFGLGARQFGLSERFQPRVGRSLWGGGSLQSPEWWGLDFWDLWEVLLLPRSAGGHV